MASGGGQCQMGALHCEIERRIVVSPAGHSTFVVWLETDAGATGLIGAHLKGSYLIALVATALFLTACDNAAVAVISRAHEAATQTLVDPESARFRNDYVDAAGGVCGEVNAKNRMGGYVGFTPYIWNSQHGVSVLPTASPYGSVGEQVWAELDRCDFTRRWTATCGKQQGALLEAGLVAECKFQFPKPGDLDRGLSHRRKEISDLRKAQGH
jgi:hypothetical protein